MGVKAAQAALAVDTVRHYAEAGQRAVRLVAEQVPPRVVAMAMADPLELIGRRGAD